MAIQADAQGHYILSNYNAATNTSTPATPVALPSDLASALAAEITNDPASRGYAGKSAQDVADLLNGTYETANPVTTQPMVTLTELTPAQLAALGSAAMEAVNNLPSDNAYKAGLLAAMQAQEGFLGQLPENSISSPAISGFIQGVIASTAMTQEQINAYIQVPDPTWTAQIINPSRASVVTPGYYIQASDIPGGGS